MRDFDVVGATLPAVTAAASGHVGAPLSAARQELAVLNAQLEAASQALAAANEPVARLYGLIGDVQRAEQDLIARRNRHDGEIGQWIASGCRGERPFADPDLVAAERTLGEAAENARAARSALPALEQTAAQAAERVRTLQAARNEAFGRAVVEIVAAYTRKEFAGSAGHYLRHAGKIMAIVEVLRQRHDHRSAGEIEAALNAARLGRPVTDAAEAGAFLDRLMRDPEAQL